MLIAIVLIMTAGYFSWSENIAITRVLKIFFRLGMTAAIIMVHRALLKLGAIASHGWQNTGVFIFYLLYLLLGFSSFMWSTAPGYSALQWFMTAESLIFAYYLIRTFLVLDVYFPGHSLRFYRTFGNACFGLLFLFLVGSFAAPSQFFRAVEGGTALRLGGYLMNPNELGMLSGVGISCLTFDVFKKHRLVATLFKLGVMIVVLLLTQSRSSLIGLALILYFHIRRSENTQLKLTLTIAALCAVPAVASQLIMRSGGIEDILSMTGRLPFWKALVLEGVPKEPWFGFGFMRIAYTDHFESIHTYSGHMTHNTFLQVLLNLGFVGFVVMVFQLLFTFIGIRKQPTEKRMMIVGICIPILINSLTEFGIFGETNYGILFFQFIIFLLVLRPPKRLTSVQKNYLKRKRPDLKSPQYV